MKQTNDHKCTVHKLTEEEARKRDTAQRPRPAWMPQDCMDTPTRYLCRCFDHSARDAVGKVCFTTKIPPMALRDISCGDFTIDELIARMLDELTFQIHNETYSGPANTADLLCAFFDFLEYSVVTYLEKRHTDADGKGGERVAAAVTKIIEGVDAAEMVLAVTPAEFSRRVAEMLNMDADAAPAGAPREAGGATAKRGRKIAGEPLRQNGQTITPKGKWENGPEWEGQKKQITCGFNTLKIGKQIYTVPPALCGFVSDLLDAYENGNGWIKSNVKKWQSYCKSTHSALKRIVKGKKVGNNYTGEYRIWLEK